MIEYEVPLLKIPAGLKQLIDYCEKPCVKECCGISAYDFSPIHIASFVSGSSGRIDDSDIKRYNDLIDQFEKDYVELTPHGELTCRINELNQLFTDQSIRRLFAELRHSLSKSRAILELSRKESLPLP